MARLNADPAGSSSVRGSSIYEDTPPRTGRRRADRTPTYTVSPGPTSDKENSHEAEKSKKRNSGSMGPPALPTPTTDARASKRRRLVEMSSTNVNTRPGPDQWYNPVQPESERSEVTKGYRDVNREFQDNRDRLLRPDNNEIIGLIGTADDLMGRVRQTNVATMDSRFLVGATDLILKKANLLALGDGSTGIDVDEFVSKCISFMRNGGPPVDEDDEGDAEDDQSTPRPTQRNGRTSMQQSQRRRQSAVDDEDEEGGDALAWDVLGKLACFPNNSRPSVPGHLLGPLGVQKRSRALSQRKPRMQESQQPKTQPKTLDSQDLERAENSNLTTLCKNIRSQLVDVLDRGRELVGEQWKEDITPAEEKRLMKRARLASDGNASLFEFAINPRSFGQTVENLFYISFLIREGNVAIGKDCDGLPTLAYSNARSITEQREQNVTKHQAVFSIDWGTWQGLIRAYDIKKPLIPHRDDEQGTQITARGWYG